MSSPEPEHLDLLFPCHGCKSVCFPLAVFHSICCWIKSTAGNYVLRRRYSPLTVSAGLTLYRFALFSPIFQTFRPITQKLSYRVLFLLWFSAFSHQELSESLPTIEILSYEVFLRFLKKCHIIGIACNSYIERTQGSSITFRYPLYIYFRYMKRLFGQKR